MEDQALRIKAGITALIAALTILWGWFGWLVIALLIVMTVDYITGWAKARNSGTWKSSIAKKGRDKKVGVLAIVGVAGLIDWVIGMLIPQAGIQLPFTYGVLICPLVVVWYLLAECGSILENCKGLGTKEIPFLSKLINVLKKSIEKTGDKIIPGEVEDPNDTNNVT